MKPNRTEEFNMLRAIGYVFLVLLIGTFAIAWTSHEQQKTANRVETLAPDNFHLSAKPVPVPEVNDMTFIYTNEK
jgi:hypothetical protein